MRLAGGWDGDGVLGFWLLLDVAARAAPAAPLELK